MNQLAAVVLIASGVATRYDADVMQQVVHNRVRWGQLDPAHDVAGFVALLECDRIGQTVWLETPKGLLFRVQVADCAAAQHREQLQRSRFAVDLSWPLAQTLGVVEAPGGGFRVWDRIPPGRVAVQ